MNIRSISATSPSLPVSQLRLRETDLALTHVGLLIIIVHFAAHGYDFNGVGPTFLLTLAISTVWDIISIKLHHKIHPFARPFFNAVVTGVFAWGLFSFSGHLVWMQRDLDQSIQQTRAYLLEQDTSDENRASILSATEWQRPLQSGNVYQIVPVTLLAAIMGLCGCIHFILFVLSSIEVHRHRRGTSLSKPGLEV